MLILHFSVSRSERPDVAESETKEGEVSGRYECSQSWT
jgi:hypothetical protein